MEKLLKISAIKNDPGLVLKDRVFLDEAPLLGLDEPPEPSAEQPIGLEATYSIISQDVPDLNRPPSRTGSLSFSSIPTRQDSSVSFSLPLGPLPFSGRGGPICRADSCLFLACLPLALSERQLHIECSKYGFVESINMWNGSNNGGLTLLQGEAYVCFQTTIP